MDYPAKELLRFILESIEQIRFTFKDVKSVDDLLDRPEAVMRLDAISMRVQAIGETIKNIQKHDPALLTSVAPKDYWSDIAKMRDIISHHYINIDAEVVFDVCANELDQLEAYIKRLYHADPPHPQDL